MLIRWKVGVCFLATASSAIAAKPTIVGAAPLSAASDLQRLVQESRHIGIFRNTFRTRILETSTPGSDKSLRLVNTSTVRVGVNAREYEVESHRSERTVRIRYVAGRIYYTSLNIAKLHKGHIWVQFDQHASRRSAEQNANHLLQLLSAGSAIGLQKFSSEIAGLTEVKKVRVDGQVLTTFAGLGSGPSVFNALQSGCSRSCLRIPLVVSFVVDQDGQIVESSLGLPGFFIIKTKKVAANKPFSIKAPPEGQVKDLRILSKGERVSLFTAF